ncbi:MAG: hypothetical protein PQ964_00515 [Methanobacteriaceae archaeon]|jgi:hypothetical protein
MDDKGFIFTTDATLALAIFMVFSASFVTYYGLPDYMGVDHEHLERIAADALQIMHQDGTLHKAALQYANNNTTGAQNTLNSALSILIPSNTGYRIRLARDLSVENSRGLLHATNVATRSKVISAPREGWMGRSWYKVEEARFVDQPTNVTTTLWNFHNWLSNFEPWGAHGLHARPFWGGTTTTPQTPQNIQFPVPEGATINSAVFILGSANHRNGTSYAANVSINGVRHSVNSTQFNFLNFGAGGKMYNHLGNVSGLRTGVNNFHVNFWNMTREGRDGWGRLIRRYNMPWFSIIANYTARFRVPEGLLNRRFNFNDAAGLAVPTPQDLDGVAGNETARIYNLRTGTVNSFTAPSNRRTMNWETFTANRSTLDAFDDGMPFVITHLPRTQPARRPDTRHGSAVSVIQEFNIPDNVRILDAYTVLNAYGAVDNAMVEVWDGTQWRTVFCSFDFREIPSGPEIDFSARPDGYGNIPGILYIGDRLRAGNNSVRITIWDRVPSTDYDLVGLVDSYTHVTYTRLPIRWENFAFRSFQSNTRINQLPHTFTTEANAREVYLFIGAGLDSRRLIVEVAPPGVGGGWQTLYNSNVIPFYLNLASLDTGGVFTNRSGGNYTIRPGVNYRVRVTVHGPANAWESGDRENNPNAQIFSGTRVSVLYPEFLENRWAAAHSNDPITAKQLARQELIAVLRQAGITPDHRLIRDEALFTGELPNSIPVRLELWRH